MMQVALWIVGIAVALLALDRLGVWAERTGWIYWRRRGRSSAMSGVFAGMDVVANTGAAHVEQAKQQKKLEERDNGHPPSVVG